MRIGVFQQGWWTEACKPRGHDVVALPVATHPSGNAYASDMGSRLAVSQKNFALIRNQEIDFLLDNSGTGLGFLPGQDGSPADVTMMHESAGLVLCSHFIDPLITAFQGIGWQTAWQCLQSSQWVKAIWDRAQAYELQRFGVPNVLHLPMAAPLRDYDTTPIAPDKQRRVVSFVGGQNSNFFTSNQAVGTASLLPGVLANATHADMPNAAFWDLYHEVFGLANPIMESDDANTRLQKTTNYFNAKLFYNASLCMRNRDRFVIFLVRKLGENFHLHGNGWDTAYGIPARQQLPSGDAYFQHFRDTAININLVNGNAEGGLNMRHFEITAAGGFMLCYQQPELAECFEIGKECVAFTSETDLIEKIDYYLQHPQERAEIAAAGQRRTLANHLYSHRLDTLLHALAPAKPPVEFSLTNWTDDCKQLLPEADIVLDIGANVGHMTKGLRRLYPSAEIHSFEPVPEAFEKLQKTCEEISAYPVQKAVADSDGTMTINLTASSECHSILGFQEGNPCAQWTRIVGQQEVDVCTLDHWCEESNIDPARIDLLKLDIQGAELKALHGARKILKSAKVVYTEVSFVPIYKESPLLSDIDGFMNSCGFRRHAIYPSDQPHNWGDALYVKK